MAWNVTILMGDLTALDYEGEGQREGLREEQRVLL